MTVWRKVTSLASCFKNAMSTHFWASSVSWTYDWDQSNFDLTYDWDQSNFGQTESLGGFVRENNLGFTIMMV
jgi:hypothetical protein